MSNGWFDAGIPDAQSVERPRRGTLRGDLIELVDYCLGQRPPQWPMLSTWRVHQAFESQCPGLISRSGAYGQVLAVRQKPFQAWALRNRTRFIESAIERRYSTSLDNALEEAYNKGFEIVQNDPLRWVMPGDNDPHALDAEMKLLSRLDQEGELRKLRGDPLNFN